MADIKELIPKAIAAFGDRNLTIGIGTDDKHLRATEVTTELFASTIFTIKEGAKGEGDRWSPFTITAAPSEKAIDWTDRRTLSWSELALANDKPAPRPEASQIDSALLRYATKAFDGEVAAVRLAREGTRNATLNTAALKLGSLVGAGLLTEALVRSALTSAASEVGLAAPEITATLNSGLKAREADEGRAGTR